MNQAHITIQKSNRKTLCLSFTDEGKLLIKTPYYISQHQINQFIEKNQKWIDKQKLKIARQKQENPEKKLQNGEIIHYLGKKYTIITLENIQKPMFNFPCLFIPNDHLENKKKKLTQFLKIRAKDIFTDRLDQWAEAMNLSYKSLKLSSAKTRWGSCSSKKNINLNWKLIFAPMNIIDSVVIHELAHLKHMNHSKDFWEWVRQFDPNEKKHTKWLKENGFLLNL